MPSTQADDVYETFIHNWEIDVSGGRISRLGEVFSTAHGLGVYEWKLKLSTEDEYNFLRPPRNNGGVCQLSLEPSLTFESGRSYILHGVIFLVEGRAADGEVMVGPTLHRLEECNFNNNSTSEVRVPSDSALGRTLHDICSGKTGATTLCITTVILIPKRCFELGLFTNAARSVPVPVPNLFRIIDDPALHDVRLRCQNGVFPCNRNALFQTSKYFRLLMRTNQPEYDEDCSLAAVSTVIVYMLTGTYYQPSPITVHLIEEMVRLIRRYRPSVVKPFHVALEKTACEQLVSEGDYLEQVLKWYLSAADCDMSRLENAAMALLLERHYNQLAVEFIVAEPRKPHLRELHERLHARVNIFRHGPLQKILRCRGNAVPLYEKMAC